MMQIGGGKRVLLMGGEGVVIYTPSGNGVDRETAIAWDVPNFDQQLVDILSSQNENKPVLVLFDGADQTYRKEENIPKLSSLDRPRFVKRKLDLAFPSYPIRASLEIKPPKKKGFAAAGGQSYLFVALPETEQIDRIGQALLEAGVPVSGFGLLPAESAGLVTELSAKVFGAKGRKLSRWCVLIGQHETGGLRQVVVKDDNLALTRLTPMSGEGATGAGWSEEVVREFKATLTYISRFGYNVNDGLDVIVVCGDIEKQFFNEKDLGATNFRCISVTEALGAIGSKSFGLEKSNYADALHAAWAGKKNALKLPVRVPSIHRIMAPRLAARAGGSLMVLAAIGLSYLAFTDYQEYRVVQEDIMQRQNQKAMLDREYTAESKIFDALPVKPQLIKGALAVKKTLESNSVRLPLFLQTLKKALGADITLSELYFEHAPAIGLGINTARTPGTIPPSMFLQDGTQDKGKIKIVFKFGLPNNMQLEQKVTRAEQMQKDLQAAFPGYAVEIVSQFGKVDRQGKFEADLGTAGVGASAMKDMAEFKLEGPPL